MEIVLLVLICSIVAGLRQDDSSLHRTHNTKLKKEGLMKVSVTAEDEAVNFKATKSSLNTNDYIKSLKNISQDQYTERIIHANGAGALGYFEVTSDISHICKASFFSKVGKKTPIAIRFSSALIRRGAPDTQRDFRGFAVKFYTDEGIFDIAGFNTPVFFSKDPAAFLKLVKAIQENPGINLLEQEVLWEYVASNPNIIFILLFILGDGGIPDGYRYMPNYSIHTYTVCNDKGVDSLVRFHFIPCAEKKYLTTEEALEIAATDPYYAIRDLYDAIARGEFPRWQVSLQILSQNDVAEAKRAGLDVHDVTKVLPEDRFPLQHVGELVLNQNTKFSDVEQLAFNVGNVVPGIEGSTDEIFKVRKLAYTAAQNNRFGCGFSGPAFTRPGDSGRTVHSSHCNNVNSNKSNAQKYQSNLPDMNKNEDGNLAQAADWYANKMSSEERVRLVSTAARSLCAAGPGLRRRAVRAFREVHPDLGDRIATRLDKIQC